MAEYDVLKNACFSNGTAWTRARIDSGMLNERERDEALRCLYLTQETEEANERSALRRQIRMTFWAAFASAAAAVIAAIGTFETWWLATHLG
jgi:hypothetical protein